MNTIADILAGGCRDGETVHVTGIANGFDYRTTKQDHDWTRFLLLADGASILVALLPKPYRQFQARLGPAVGADNRPQPPHITVIGRVDYSGIFGGPSPAIVADTIVRLSADAGPSLAEERAASEALWARDDVQAAYRQSLTAVRGGAR